MIYRNRTSAWLKSKYLLLVPVLALAITLMAARKYVYRERKARHRYIQENERGNGKPIVSAQLSMPVVNATKPLGTKSETEKAQPMVSASKRTRILLDRWPGFSNNSTFIANTLKYPKQAYLDGGEGQVLVDTLPLKVREKIPGFWGNRSVYSPVKTAPIGDKLVKEMFEPTTINFQDSTPPKTRIPGYGYGYTVRLLQENHIDLKIKLPKK